MKTAIIAIVLLALLCCFLSASAFPANNDDFEDHYRVKRFTCDVLSFEVGGVSLDEPACNTHCYLRLKPGGHCNHQRVCVCNR